MVSLLNIVYACFFEYITKHDSDQIDHPARSLPVLAAYPSRKYKINKAHVCQHFLEKLGESVFYWEMRV